jgi:hypothetical protein
LQLAIGYPNLVRRVDVFFIVAAGGGRELTDVKVRDADSKSAVEIAREMNRRCAAIEAGNDPDLGRGKALLTRLPPGLLRAALHLGAWLTSDLNLDLSHLGMPRQAFDHRYVDGFHAAQFAQSGRSYCEAPASFEPPLHGDNQRSVNKANVIRPQADTP